MKDKKEKGNSTRRKNGAETDEVPGGTLERYARRDEDSMMTSKRERERRQEDGRPSKVLGTVERKQAKEKKYLKRSDFARQRTKENDR